MHPQRLPLHSGPSSGHLIGVLPADPGEAGVGGFIAVPKPAESKGCTGYLTAVKIPAPFQRHLLPQFVRESQPVQSNGIQCQLTGGLGHAARSGCAKGVPGIAVVSPADLQLPPAQRLVFREAQHNALTNPGDIRVGGKPGQLLLCDVFQRHLGVVARLTKRHFHHVFRLALGQGKEGGEHQGCQQNGNDRNEITACILLE